MDESSLDEDPLRQFRRWFRAAQESGVVVPEAMALATATPDGRPSARMVLLKRTGKRGFDFHTNFESRKGAELGANPYAALLFHWQPQVRQVQLRQVQGRQVQGRQVRVEGEVERVSDEESEEYFRTRPAGARLAAWASPQSRPLADRAELERIVAQAGARFRDEEVPLPSHWGGFRLVPESYEFWEHGDDRLHDRVRYERDGDGWRRSRLAP